MIKAIVADALGMHLDSFQRINVDPGSLTVIRYGKVRPFVVKVNDNGGNVDALIPPKTGAGAEQGRAAGRRRGRVDRRHVG